MKNILYIGPYHQNDGWGYAAREYLRAIKLTGHNIHSRPIYLNTQTKYNHFDEFNDVELNKSNSFDVIIQHGLPNLFRYYGDVLNIGISFFETYNIKSTPWVPFINMMDQFWVSSYYEQETLERSGVEIPVHVVKIPTDTNKFAKQYEFPDLDAHKQDFKFYFIGEYGTRKNINALLLAYYREFHNSEQTRLVLKLNKVGMEANVLLTQIKKDITTFNTVTHRIYQRASDYKDIVIIPSYLEEERLYGLHQACQCFVMPSYGEAFCLPAFDATMFGNDTLVNKNTGMRDFTPAYNHIESHLVPAVAVDRPLSYLYTGLDEWHDIDILSLQHRMRWAFNHRDDSVDKLLNDRFVKQTLPKYSYKSVADHINSII